jgi:hypothetical protein
MKIELFLHRTGRLAVRPTLEPGETYTSVIRVLRPVPCRRWHPSERLWTLTLGAPGLRPALKEFVDRGWVGGSNEDGPPESLAVRPTRPHGPPPAPARTRTQPSGTRPRRVRR